MTTGLDIDMAKPPIVLGVTGHRNFATDDPAMTALVLGECARLKAAHPSNAYVILSGLAEGADRLVVRVAQETLGAQLINIMPLPRDLYEKDFADDASRTEYGSLLSECFGSIHAPHLAPIAQLADYGEPRNRQYAWQGAFIAERAQILFAIWDGAPARGTGGTAQVVDWFLKGAAPADYQISETKRIDGAPGVAKELIHINPVTSAVERRPAAAF